MRFRLTARTAAAALAAAVLAACSSGTGSPGGSSDAGPPRRGGTLRVVKQTEPSSLDPAKFQVMVHNDGFIASALFGELLVVQKDGRVEYSLAKGLTTSDRGKTWALRIRDGVKFTDGTPLDAAAVAYNWTRIKDPATGSTGRAFASLIDTMTPKGQTLHFKLTRPVADFAAAIAADLNTVASPKALRAGPQDFDKKPAGAGPFVLESWQRGGRMVLTRNPRYWDAPRPYLDKIVLTANTDVNQMFATQQSGGADAFASSATDLLAQAEQQGLTVAASELGAGTTLNLNTRQAPFDDVRARRAVLLGVDRAAVNTAVYKGTATVPDTFFQDGSPYNGGATLPKFDKAAATKLFSELAGEGKPVTFTITTYQVTQIRRVAEAIQAQLNQYPHVRVEVEALDYSSALSKTTRRQFQAVVSSLAFDNPSPRLFTFLGSGQPGNISSLASPELDAALAEGMAATDEQARNAANRKIAELYSRLAPALIYIRSAYGLAYPADRVHGVELYARSAIRADRLWMSR